jgi:hypothetical protein
MHRELLPDSKIIDHIDGNGLNNQRDNLRATTNQENCLAHVKLSSANTTGITGVYRHGQTQWTAKASINGRLTHLGVFDQFGDAVKARKEAELLYYLR